MHSSLRTIAESPRYSNASTPLDDRAVAISRSLYTKIPDWDLVARLKELQEVTASPDIPLPTSLYSDSTFTASVHTVSMASPINDVSLSGTIPVQVGDVFEVDFFHAPSTNYAVAASINTQLSINGTLFSLLSAPSYRLSSHAVRYVIQVQVAAATFGVVVIRLAILHRSRNDDSGQLVEDFTTSSTGLLLVPSSPTLAFGARLTWVSGSQPFSVRFLKREILHRRYS